MKKLLNNEYGLGVNLALATVLIAVAMSAMVSLVDLIQDDRNTVNWTKDKLQQELFLRSENRRINFIQEKRSPIWPSYRRVIEMITRDRISVFYIEHDNREDHGVPSPIGPRVVVNMVEAWCYTRHSRRFGYTYDYVGKDSPVVSYIRKLSRRSSLAQYQYFSDNEMSDISNNPNQTASIVRFDGRDVLHGPVHSNTSIFCRNTGQGNNGGWPLFLGKVTTGGKLMNFTGSSSIDLNLSQKEQIFQGGYEEEVPPIIYEPDATDIKRKGTALFGEGARVDIAYCVIDRNRIIYQLGTIRNTSTRFYVHTTYPDAMNPNTPIGDTLFHQYIDIPDTNWTETRDTGLSNSSLWINSTVWVRGVVSGAMTIGAKNAYTTGNITYFGTTPGQKPDDDIHPNRFDYFGLVSEGKILIKYKYKGPDGRLRYAPNSNGPNGRVFLYGAYSAQGIATPSLGNFAYKTEGVFSYEYQHPHGAPLDYIGWIPGSNPPRDTLFTYISFRRLRYQPTTTVNAPANWPNYWPGVSVRGAHNGFPDVNTSAIRGFYTMYDHPLNNPVWPEMDLGSTNTIPGDNLWPLPLNANALVYQRGTLSVYGSIAQRRRGFMNRSGVLDPSDNPDTAQYWDIDNFVFGGPHSSTGYEKDYHYDRRFLHVQPPHYPEVYHGSAAGRLSAFEEESWNFHVPKPRARQFR
jgi:hypothetical protein